MWYIAVAESRHIRGTELYRRQKNPFMYDGAEKSLSLNQAWLQCPR